LQQPTLKEELKTKGTFKSKLLHDSNKKEKIVQIRFDIASTLKAIVFVSWVLMLLLDVCAAGTHHQLVVHLNPAMAGAQSFGCGRQSDVTHGVIAHGLGPLAGAILYVQYNFCQFSVPSSSPDQW
jgi:hypothetical protein